jgi:LAO/AO transport system kinase
MAAELAGRLLARERAAVPEALNLVDDERAERRRDARALLDHLERHRAALGAMRVGVTGAPGSGKSTLLDALVRVLRATDRTVGILAVDPSSRRTGGALLGDRVRMRSGASDPGVYLRSMAARDQLGGLAAATGASLEILSAVFDCVFVETVGIGQSEGDVATLTDTVVFVAQPGAGDTLQFMKAGILELPDVFVVNKADTGSVARRTAHELEAGLGLSPKPASGWTPPVILASARDGTRVDEIVRAIEAHREHLERSGELAVRRSRSRAASVQATLVLRFGSFGVERLGGPDAIEARVREAAGTSVQGLVEQLSAEIVEALRG